MSEQGSTPGGRRGYAGTWPPRAAAPAGGYVPSRPALWAPFVEILRQWVRAEAGAGRLLPWVPVAFGTGIGFYFAADHEPVLAVAAVFCLTLFVAAPLCGGAKIFPSRGLLPRLRGGFWGRAR